MHYLLREDLFKLLLEGPDLRLMMPLHALESCLPLGLRLGTSDALRGLILVLLLGDERLLQLGEQRLGLRGAAHIVHNDPLVEGLTKLVLLEGLLLEDVELLEIRGFLLMEKRFTANNLQSGRRGGRLG